MIDHAGLTTWQVSGPRLHELARELRGLPGVEQAVAFGGRLHVSGGDADTLEKSIRPFRKDPHQWERITAGLEDVFIHLMGESKDNYAP